MDIDLLPRKKINIAQQRLAYTYMKSILNHDHETFERLLSREAKEYLRNLSVQFSEPYDLVVKQKLRLLRSKYCNKGYNPNFGVLNALRVETKDNMYVQVLPQETLDSLANRTTDIIIYNYLFLNIVKEGFCQWKVKLDIHNN